MNEKRLLKDNANAFTISPIADIIESPNEYMVVLEMPGVSRENVEITLTGNGLEVSGMVDNVNSDHNNKGTYKEYKLYNYKRKFKIGEDIDRNSIEANMNKGVLTVKLSKAEKVKPMKIEVKAG